MSSFASELSATSFFLVPIAPPAVCDSLFSNVPLIILTVASAPNPIAPAPINSLSLSSVEVDSFLMNVTFVNLAFLYIPSAPISSALLSLKVTLFNVNSLPVPDVSAPPYFALLLSNNVSSISAFPLTCIAPEKPVVDLLAVKVEFFTVKSPVSLDTNIAPP